MDDEVKLALIKTPVGAGKEVWVTPELSDFPVEALTDAGFTVPIPDAAFYS